MEDKATARRGFWTEARRKIPWDLLLVALLTGLLSLGGVWLGTYLTAQNQRTQWARDTDLAQKREILQKRIELADRTTRVVNRLPVAAYLSSVAKIDRLDSQVAVLRKKSGVPASNASVEHIVQAADIKTELLSVMTLDSLYFGPKTAQAVRNLNVALSKKQSWWEVDGKYTQALLDAMGSELKVYLE